MNTIEDLKATLAVHGDVHDDNLVGRSADIAGRVRTAKRRRRAAVAGVAAAAVAVAGAGMLAISSPDRTNQNLLADQPVPDQLEVLGYRYDFVDGVESRDGANRLKITVPAADVDQLVTWATAGEDQTVTVDTEWDEPFLSARPDFADWVVVPAGETMRLTVRAESQVALATFEQVPQPLDGRVEHGIAFRQVVEGSELVNAVVGEPGQTEVSVEVTLPEGRLSFAQVCQSTEGDNMGNGPMIDFEVNGTPMWGTTCGPLSEFPVDGGTRDLTSEPRPGLRANGRTYRPGETVTFTARLTDQVTGRPVEDDQAVLALGIYEIAGDVRHVLGNPIGQFIESDGHLWELDRAPTGRAPMRNWNPGLGSYDERVLIGTVHGFDDRGTLDLARNGNAFMRHEGLAQGSSIDLIVSPEDLKALGISTENATGEAGFLVYKLVR